MKKFFIVAVIAAAMASCSDSSTTNVNQDSINAAKTADSLKALTPATPDTMAPRMDTMAPKMDTASTPKP